MANYLNNKDLYYQLIVSKALGRLTPQLTTMIVTLVKNVITKFSYRDNNDRLDIIQGATLHLLTKWRSFDPDKTDNAFAYLTEIAKRSIANEWNKLHKLRGDPNNEMKVISIHWNPNDGKRITDSDWL